MTRAPSTPAETFVSTLATLARRHPQIDGLVWWEQDGWPDAPSQDLDAEEIPFFAEGLLAEGFRLEWRLSAPTGSAADRPDTLHLFVWEEPAPPPPPAAPGTTLAAGRWPPPGA